MATAIGSFVLSLLVWMLVSTIPTVMLTTAIFGHGDLKAFAIGSLVPMTPLVVGGVNFISGSPTILHGIVASLILTIAGGFGGVVAVFTRRGLGRLGNVKLPWIDD
jgi:hypothetical protein